jgi:hypothetical protein
MEIEQEPAKIGGEARNRLQTVKLLHIMKRCGWRRIIWGHLNFGNVTSFGFIFSPSFSNEAA